MQKTGTRRICSTFLCMMLIVAMACMTVGCNESNAGDTTAAVQSDAQLEGGEIGEGSKEFAFMVVDQDGKTTEFQVHTDKEIVGEALLELGLIAGEDSEYGLYVKTVNGVTLDYDTDGKYWAFYVNDAYASAGVDTTPIADGETYAFKAE